MDIKLDDPNYDYIVLGTGLTESIVSVFIQKYRKKILNIDIDILYGSSLKTMNLKEMIKYINNKNDKK